MLFFFEITSKPELVQKYLLLLFAIFSPEFGYSQYTDSLIVEPPVPKARRVVNTFAAPVAFVAAGLMIQGQNHHIQHFLNQQVDERGPKAPSNVSDYTQFAPMAMVFALTASHHQGEHKFMKQLSLAVQSEALMIAMVRPLKTLTNERRPDGGPHSFPSGHTAQAFMAATFLHKEFGKKSIWYSITGYTLATAVGSCRMMSNRHWASDVLVGAGVGILSTNLVYLMHKDKKKDRNFISKMNISASPTSLYLSMKL